MAYIPPHRRDKSSDGASSKVVCSENFIYRWITPEEKLPNLDLIPSGGKSFAVSKASDDDAETGQVSENPWVW